MATPSNNIIDVQDVKKVWRLFSRYWYVYLGFLIVGGVVAYFYIRQTTPIYKAKISVLLESEQQSRIQQDVLGGLQGRSAYMSYIGSRKKLKNEKRIIKSNPLVKETLQRLDFDISYYLIGRTRTTLQYKTTPFEVEFHKDGNYSGPYRIELIDLKTYRLVIPSESKSYNKVHRYNEPVRSKYFHLTVKKNHRLKKLKEREDVSLKEVEYKFKVNNMGQLVRKFKRGLSISSQEYSDILDITCTDISSERAEDFLDTLANVYLEHSVKRKKKINQSTLRFINQQLSKVAGRLNKIERKLQGYKSENFLVNLDQAQQTYFQELLQYEKDKVKLRMQRRLINYLYEYIKENKQEAFEFSPALLKEEDYPYLKEYFNQLQKLQKRKQEILENTTSESFKAQQVESEIQSLREKILEHLKKIKQQSIPLNIKEINQQINEYRSKIQQIPEGRRKLLNIKRRLKVNEEVYVYLLEKRAETIISKGSILADKSVLSAARSAGKVKPNERRIYISSLGIGFILALLGVFINELFFKKITTREELEEMTDIPIIGLVGRVPKDYDTMAVVDEHPKSPLAESFRSIRTNLDYMSPEQTHRLILVTSSFEQEGKTFCAFNTAIMLAKAQKKTLLLDLDLHRPSIHKHFGVQNDKGMTTYLIGHATQKQIIRSTSYDNLDVVMAGPIPPNPSELLLSGKFEKFLERMKKKYDDIVIDTPPTGPKTDALVLMKHSDINLYVVRAHTANKDYIQQAHEVREKHNPKNLSLILNGVKKLPHSYRYYYYY